MTRHAQVSTSASTGGAGGARPCAGAGHLSDGFNRGQFFSNSRPGACVHQRGVNAGGARPRSVFAVGSVAGRHARRGNVPKIRAEQGAMPHGRACRDLRRDGKQGAPSSPATVSTPWINR